MFISLKYNYYTSLYRINILYKEYHYYRKMQAFSFQFSLFNTSYIRTKLTAKSPGISRNIGSQLLKIKYDILVIS